MNNGFLSVFFNIIPIHIYRKNIDGLFIECNKAQANFFGKKTEKDIIGKTDYDFLPYDIAKKITENDHKVIMSKQKTALEELSIKLSGEKNIFLSYKYPEIDSDRNVVGIFGISIEITDYVKRWENTNQTLSEVLKSIPEHVYWKDLQGAFMGCNMQQALSIGLSSPEELIGKTDYDIFPKDQADSISKTDQEIIKTGKEKMIIEKTNEADGQLVVYKSHKAPLKNKDGNIIGILGVSVDITELEETKKQLENALHIAQAAEKAKASVVHNLRHDWITPFSGIFSINQHLYSNESDIEKKELLKMAKESSELIMHHTKSILDMINASEGVPAIEEKPFNLFDLSNNVYKMFLPEIHFKNLNFTLDITHAPLLIRGDKTRVERILMCFLSNSVKFIKENSKAAFKISIEKLLDEKIFVNFIFKDNGIGMTDEQMNQMYEPLYRAYPAYEARYTGAGTGLTIAKQYIGDLNGQIVCKSAPNEGTTFIITIPFKQSYIEQETIDKA